MKIKLFDGSEIDTEMLTDVDALMTEKLEELIQIAETYKIPLYCAARVGSVPIAIHCYTNTKDFLGLIYYTAFNFNRFSGGVINFSVETNPEKQ